MKKDAFSVGYALGLSLVAFIGSTAPLSAEDLRYFNYGYRVIEGSVVITHYYTFGSRDVTIPAEIGGMPVTAIGSRAFYDCRCMTNVTIPSTVTSIGEYAFFNSRVAKVTIPSGVTSIGERAFWGCKTLTSIEIPTSVTSIGSQAFYGCRGLTKVTIPSGVTSIGERAFELCGGLTHVTIASGGSTLIGTRAFAHCDGLRHLTIAGVTSIGNYAFYGCKELTNITIPSSVTSIGRRAFSYCEGLTRIAIPSSVTSMEHGALSHCDGLTHVAIASGLTAISNQAFYHCEQLSSVTLPSSIVTIGDRAFGYCDGLTSIAIPASVTAIGKAAFEKCSGLRAAVFLGDAPELGAQVFESGVTIYYFVGQPGFSSPTWNGYSAIALDETVSPIALWQLIHGYTHVNDLRADPNGDGVSLLMAYALDLNPNLDLRGSMPAPVLGPDHVSMSFYAARPAITYSVETSTDLQTWVSEGVTTSELGPDNRRTAVVERDSEKRFLRLRVEH